MLRRPWRLLAAALTLPLLAVAPGACASEPLLVDGDTGGGFAVYRSGRLDRKELAQLCRAGVTELVVLDGSAAGRECRLRAEVCPGLAIRYDRTQSARRPVSDQFLGAFDAWVEEARTEGRKIAYRCTHGWHRTGRLSAYYRMRFQGIGPDEAIAEMKRLGRYMGRHPQLEPQVRAMADHLAGRPCSTEPRHCVALEPSGGPLGETFPADVCP